MYLYGLFYMHDLQYNGGKQLHAAMGLTAACVHKSAL